MRTDHVAYQQATRVAGLGLLLQAGIGLTLLLFGLAGGDTTFTVGAGFVLVGCIVWLSLVILFHQQRLERLEALEADELAQSRGTTIFDRDIEATRVAARRLHLMHAWLMPAVSILVALLLAGLGAWTIRWFGLQGDPEGEVAAFSVTGRLGWAMAVALGLSLLAFIFSRFVAGMARQPAWQNLRGGAAFMVGNALVTLAAAVGFGFQFAQKQAVIEGIAFGIAVFMLLIAAEILLNFVLNLYRPRRVGETPRPAFDSRLLSLLSAPDSIVRTINEAVNYQFGFDITSSWGYQLLLRSFGRLVAVAFVALVGLSCLVTVDPDQQALRLRFGRVVEVHGPGLMFKLPWPIETAELHEVGRIHEIPLTVNPGPTPPPLPPDRTKVNFWVNEDPSATDRRLFVTGASRLAGNFADRPAREIVAERGGVEETEAEARVGERFSLVDVDMAIQYRVRPDRLLDFLGFSSDARVRRGALGMREQAMRAIALSELSDFLSRLPLEDVLSPGRSGILDELRQRIQARFDAPETNVGVDVVAVVAPVIRPPADAAAKFEEYTISVQARRQQRDIAERQSSVTMAVLAGTPAAAERIVAAIARREELVKAGDAAGAAAMRTEIEAMLTEARGQPAAMIESAEADRWRTQMEALSNANRLAGDLPMYEAAPELYRQRAIMRVMSQLLPRTRIKYLLGVPSERVVFDVEMQEVDSGLNFLDAIDQNTEGGVASDAEAGR